MCVKYCVKISYKSDKKWKSYSLKNLRTLTLLPAVIFERAATHLREGRGWDNGVMYCFFLLNCPMIFLRTFLICNMQRNRFASTHCFSITPELTAWGCVLCSPPPSTRLAVLSDISKLECTGQKVDNLRNRWAYIAVFGLSLKWKSHAIAYHCAFLQFIARIFFKSM